MDTFGSVWDAADDVAADQSLASLTAARIQAAPVWPFLAKASDEADFTTRFALVEAQVRQAAEDRGVTFEALAKSLVDDYRALKATASDTASDNCQVCGQQKVTTEYQGEQFKGCPNRQHLPPNHPASGYFNHRKGPDWPWHGASLKAQASFYVTDGGEKVGGPYDTRADAQDAIDGGDVTGDSLSISSGDGEDGDGKDSDGDGDDSDESESGGGNPFAKKDDTDGDDSDSDEDQDDAKGEPDDDENPFAKKSSAQIGTCTRCGDTGVKVVKRSTDDKFVGTDCSCKKSARLDAMFPVIAAHNVVHQPGETVFVDHFMGHDEHEGRKGVWASVVASPGQHGHEDRAESHLLKPMAPGGTPFFHHFGGLNKTAYGDGPTRDYEPYEHGQDGWKSGLGSYPVPPTGEPSGSAWRPHRIYDSLSSAVNHLGGGDTDPHHLHSYNHCNSCDHVYSVNHPNHVTHGQKDQCPNCGDTDFHETASDVLHESLHAEHDGHGEAHSEDNYGDPYGKMDRKIEASRKTAADDKGHSFNSQGYCQGCGMDTPDDDEEREDMPSCKTVNQTFSSRKNAAGLCSGAGATPPSHIMSEIRNKGGSNRTFDCPSGCGAKVTANESSAGSGTFGVQSHAPGSSKSASRKTALPDGVDPLQWIVETVPSGEGQAEAEAHHDTSVRVASLVDLFRTTKSQE